MTLPLEIREAYGLGTDLAELDVQHIPSNINRTYVVRRKHGASPPLVLQRLHPVFGAQVHIDIEAVTAHLIAHGLETPCLVRTLAGELWTLEESAPERHVWRAQTYVEGVTFPATRDPSLLESAAALLGRFQSALADLTHTFVHVRALHDTARHLANLEAALASERGRGDIEAQELGAQILRHAEAVRIDFSGLPKRMIHGDPKLSNVMFERPPSRQARCMIDLDTVGRGYLAHELGDALRSWCNPAGEDTTIPELQPEAVAAVMRGYASRCPPDVGSLELSSGLDGFETISIELASRFAADVVNDTYWGWDSTRFASRRAHNIVRARGQLALSQAVRSQRSGFADAADRALEAVRQG